MKSILELKELDKGDAKLVFSLSPRATRDKKIITVSDLMESDSFFRDYCAFRKFEPGYPLVTEFESLVKRRGFRYKYVELSKKVLNPKYLIKALRKSFGADGLKDETRSKMSEEELALYDKFSRAIFYEPIQNFNHKLRALSESEIFKRFANNANLLLVVGLIEPRLKEYFMRARMEVNDLFRLYLHDPWIAAPARLPYTKYALVIELYKEFIRTRCYAPYDVELIEGLPVFETLSITAGRRVAFKLARTEEFKELLSVDRMLDGDFSQWESHKVQEQFRKICLNNSDFERFLII